MSHQPHSSIVLFWWYVLHTPIPFSFHMLEGTDLEFEMWPDTFLKTIHYGGSWATARPSIACLPILKFVFRNIPTVDSESRYWLTSAFARLNTTDAQKNNVRLPKPERLCSAQWTEIFQTVIRPKIPRGPLHDWSPWKLVRSRNIKEMARMTFKWHCGSFHDVPVTKMKISLEFEGNQEHHRLSNLIPTNKISQK